MHLKKILLTLTVLLGMLYADSYAQEPNIFDPGFIQSGMVKVAQWQLSHANGKPLNTWTNAAFYTGVFAAWERTNNPVLLDSLLSIGTRYNWLPGNRYDHADDIAITQLYVDLYRIKKDPLMLKSSVDSIYKMMTTPGEQIAKKGINWWWCDALFMAPPAMAKLAATLHDPSYLVAADTMFRQCHRLLYNTDEHLFARDASYLWDEKGNGKKEANGKKLFWGRGNGWVMAGLARFLEEMPKKYAGRAFYENLFREMADRLLQLQQEDGLWRTSLLDPASYPGGEGSGSGFICYALSWGINQKVLDKKLYLPAVKKCWQGLNTLVNAEGRVGWVQPIGADPRKNFNADSWEAYGAGAFLLAGSEIVRGKIR
jgi:unsaturated rhamnogalacturonyl hydrolase